MNYSKGHKNLSNKYALYLLRTDNYCSINIVREYKSYVSQLYFMTICNNIRRSKRACSLAFYAETEHIKMKESINFVIFGFDRKR